MSLMLGSGSEARDLRNVCYVSWVKVVGSRSLCWRCWEGGCNYRCVCYEYLRVVWCQCYDANVMSTYIVISRFGIRITIATYIPNVVLRNACGEDQDCYIPNVVIKNACGEDQVKKVICRLVRTMRIRENCISIMSCRESQFSESLVCRSTSLWYVRRQTMTIWLCWERHVGDMYIRTFMLRILFWTGQVENVMLRMHYYECGDILCIMRCQKWYLDNGGWVRLSVEFGVHNVMATVCCW